MKLIVMNDVCSVTELCKRDVIQGARHSETAPISKFFVLLVSTMAGPSLVKSNFVRREREQVVPFYVIF